MATIGSVDMNVDFDGERLPRQARQIGQKTGINLSRGMEQTFTRAQSSLSNKIEKSLNVTGAKAGVEFSNALEGSLRSRRGQIASTLASLLGDRNVFDAFVKNAGGVELGLDRITSSLERAREAGIVSESQFRQLGDTFGEWGEDLRENERQMARNTTGTSAFSRAVQRLTERLNGNRAEVNRGDAANRRYFKNASTGLGNLDGETKLIIALVAAAATDIVALGSAAGAGLTLVAGSAAALALGVGVLAIGLNGVTGEISKIAAEARPAVLAFRGLGDEFRGLQQAVQGALFANLASQISPLATTLIPALQTGLVGIANVLNGLFSQVLTSLGSDSSIATISTLLAGFAPVISLLGQGVISLVGALGTLGVVAMPYLERFATTILALIDQFNAFVNSIAGQASIAEWFENAATIGSALLPLLGSIGTMFASLVTPDTVANLVTTLNDLTEFMPALGSMLLFIDAVDPIGLIAQALNELGQALAPAMPAFMELGSLIGDTLASAVSILAPMVGQLVAAFLPLVNTLLGALAPAFLTLLKAFQPVIDAISDLAPLLEPFIQLLGETLAQAVTDLAPAFEPLAEILFTFISTVLPAFMSLLQTLSPLFLQIIQAVTPLIGTILAPLAELFVGLSVAMQPLSNVLLSLLGPLLQLLEPLIALIGPLLPPLVEIILLLTNFAIVPLADVLSSLLIPIIGGAADAVLAFTPIIEGVTQVLTGLRDFLVGVFTGDWNMAWNGLADVFKGIWNTMVGYVESSVNQIISLINGIVKGINKVGEDLGLEAAIPTIPKLSLSSIKLASGGYFDRPTSAIIGEAGPEIAVPLSRPIGQVDPSVRAISALLQGKPLPGQGGSGGGGGIVFEDGAIRVSGVRDEDKAVNAVMDRFVTRAAG